MASTELQIKTGLDALPANANEAEWSTEQKALMVSLGLEGTRRRNVNGQWVEEHFKAPQSIVQAFLHQARTRRLDPLARQIYCIERGGKWGIEASIDGFRLQAERTHEYLGQTAAQWTDGKRVPVPLREDGKIVRDAAGNVIMTEDYLWVDVWVAPEPPAAARIGILRQGFAEPMWAVATYQGYCPRDRQGVLRPTGQWSVNPANQLLKCTEMLGLRKAFPTELSGLYGAEEMDQAGSVREVVRQAEAPVGEVPSERVHEQAPIAPPVLTKDWKALAAEVTTVEALTDLANDADRLGEIGILVSEADGKVIDVLRRRRAEIEQAAGPEPMVSVPRTATGRRQWAREARDLTTRMQVGALVQEATAAGAPVQVIEELEAIARSLPDEVEVEVVTSWPVAEIPVEAEWAEGGAPAAEEPF